MDIYRCPLCGYKFAKEEAKGCQECFLAKRCSLILCPNCSYEFPKIPIQKS